MSILKRSLLLGSLASLLNLVACNTTPSGSEWTSLFDGESLLGWHAYQGGVPSSESWRVEDGALVSQSMKGELVTDASFQNFELEFAWRVTQGANSGVFYRVDESAEQVHHIGLEFQVLDNIGQAGRPATEQAGACYGVIAASVDATLPVGEWNQGAIVVRGNHVVHRLNGQTVADFEIGSDSWAQQVAQGPMASLPRFAAARSGPIVLQNYHGHTVAYRDLRIRELP